MMKHVLSPSCPCPLHFARGAAHVEAWTLPLRNSSEHLFSACLGQKVCCRRCSYLFVRPVESTVQGLPRGDETAPRIGILSSVTLLWTCRDIDAVSSAGQIAALAMVYGKSLSPAYLVLFWA
ncbi:hypothetical protein L227DRAFT_207368 [Lentinus tigrinus ALCF2SS1-6]|uniref:Uncharacterized protein n=1 Tax=Lentinus tigrinus ALCF2SS1-6 TaxID=1328759 RepID=A0A5C2SQA6_9APHY|nr:hypothetical protein L227DRAFT_207368 [Lentinus tigrinus ALCF2SS1-6]